MDSCMLALEVMHPLVFILDVASGGRGGWKVSHDHIQWSEDLEARFHNARAAFRKLNTITIPRPYDALMITTNGFVRNRGIGAVLHVSRSGRWKLAGHYSLKLTVSK